MVGADHVSLSVYADSSPDPLDDPKFETIVELLRRIWVSAHLTCLSHEVYCPSLTVV